MPFCHLTLTAAKPKCRSYPRERRTLGDHIRTRRLDLALTQIEVARRIVCDESTVTNWELNRVKPTLRFWPRIVEFLGYDPRPDEEPGSLAERLKTQRRRLGLSRKRLVAILKTDPSNLAGWETGEHRPTKKSMKLITEFLSWTTSPCE